MRHLPQRTRIPLILMAFCLGISLASSHLLFAANASVSLSCKPDTLWFGGVLVGQSKNISVNMTNHGSSAVTISSISRSGTSFSASGLNLPIKLSAGQSQQFTIAFAPQVAQHLDGQFAFSITGSGAKLKLYTHGTGSGLYGFITASPSSVGFGNVQVGNNTQQTITLTNPTKSAVTISKATVSGSGFSFSGLNLPLDLTAGQSFTFKATFAPTVAGNAAGSISVTANSSHLVIPLSGVGTSSGVLKISPSTLPFGSVTVGNTKQLSAILTASGTAVNVSSATLNSSEFSLSGVSFPFTISAGKTVSFTVTFAPQAAGSASATLAFVSNASNSPISQTLTGNGQGGTSHSVDLSWNASQGSIAGYNIYRGGKTGGPYSKVNNSLDSSTAYVDSNVTSGQTYYYVTTAVGTDGMESGYSNQVQAVVP